MFGSAPALVVIVRPHFCKVTLCRPRFIPGPPGFMWTSQQNRREHFTPLTLVRPSTNELTFWATPDVKDTSFPILAAAKLRNLIWTSGYRGEMARFGPRSHQQVSKRLKNPKYFCFQNNVLSATALESALPWGSGTAWHRRTVGLNDEDVLD